MMIARSLAAALRDSIELENLIWGYFSYSVPSLVCVSLLHILNVVVFFFCHGIKNLEVRKIKI
jgi:hypothetical protein